ncbi:polysaccharide biosynthesis tyrosine autokinase [Pseudarthrobacter phenanthrenivorans]|uniref:polysaccharide biosynthesis tyrosine autokinase n=1 Tax=Pseudarthrobacter phenanthrenivorans TaxID=361575 RepID=UPI00344F80E9
MDFKDYLRVLRRNWIPIVALVLAGLLAGGAASVLTRPTYKAETQLFVAIQSSGSVLELQQGNSFSQARVQSYVKTVASPIVLQPVVDSLGLQESAADLADHVVATTDLNTVLINIAVTDSSPVQAAAIAQAVAGSLIKAVDTLEKPKAGGTSPISPSIIKPAVAPTAPAAPNVKLNLLVGLVAGLVLGLGLAMLRSTMDSRIRGVDDLRHVTDAPLLGGIAYDQDAAKRPLLTQVPGQSHRAESFRQLRTNLQFANVTGHARTVLVTSSLPGEGKSTSAANLAIALSQAGQSVCLVDADLRRPMINEYLGLDRNVGLTTCLVGDVQLEDALERWGEDDLFVLTSGQIPPNPSELLGSLEMKALISRLEESFDAVVIDAPPLLPVTDAAVLSQYVGGVVIVVGSHKVSRHDLEKSLSSLEMVAANVLGVVLNRLPAKGPDSYTYGYYTSEESSGRKRSAPNGSRQQWPSQSESQTSNAYEQSGGYRRPARAFPGRDQ